MVSKEEETRLRGNFNAASAAVKAAKAGRLQGLENAYSLAYDALVAAGLEPRLKRKYGRK